MSRGDRLRTAARGLGQTLITLGVVLLLFCVYEVYGTNLLTEREQRRLDQDLTEAWGASSAPGQQPGLPAPVGSDAPPVAADTPPVAGDAPPGTSGTAPVADAAPSGTSGTAPELGTAFARLYVPRVDGDDPHVVVEGVSVEDLKKGPGHLPGTALPGDIGNTVISGHRTTYGAPFSDVDRLAPGDALVLETRDSWFTYRVRGSEVVQPSAVEVTLPVPRRRGVAPKEALLTLTTCEPRYSARQRLIVSAVLEDAVPKSVGRPAALQGV